MASVNYLTRFCNKFTGVCNELSHFCNHLSPFCRLGGAASAPLIDNFCLGLAAYASSREFFRTGQSNQVTLANLPFPEAENDVRENYFTKGIGIGVEIWIMIFDSEKI